MAFRDKLMRFMAGRYGQDQLGKFLNIAVIVIFVISIVFSFLSGISVVFGLISSFLYFCALALLLYNYYRMFSRQIYKRTAENQKFLNAKAHMKQRKTHCFFKCPKCKTKVRVPKGKGKICITCPKCKDEFIKIT